MKVVVSDNFAKKFSPQAMQVNSTLEVPVTTLEGFVMPFVFKARVQNDAQIDEDELQRIAEQKLASVSGDLAEQIELALKEALKSSVWGWHGGSRDIYDTGALANSGKVIISGNDINVVYTAPYAQIVHNGGYIHPYGNTKIRPVYLPGRPWIQSVLYGNGPVPQFDFEGFFESRLG